MKINVVCTDVGGIYGKFVTKLREYSKHQILLNSNEPCDLTHYLPCYEMPDNPNRPCTIWLSHQEKRQDLSDKFINSVKRADTAISHSKKYMDLMISRGIKNVIQIVPGVDLKKFDIRSQTRQQKNKLVVGYVGKQFSSTERKNPKLIEKISQLPFVEFKATGGRLRETDLPKFYSSIDITVSPATIEGGPMAIQESLAVGTPIMCFSGVGMANEFMHGVYKVPFGNDEEFINQLESFWDCKEYFTFRRPEVMRALRKQVESYTWEHFVEEHDRIWSKINFAKEQK
jgi:glycosyltransferase involved in cell wall biosynthesis